MTDNAARILCRGCGFPLARLAADRRYADVTPGVQMMVFLIEQRTDLICPRCLVRRSLRDVTFSAMGVPKHPAVA
jgi:hypothetical protein